MLFICSITKASQKHTHQIIADHNFSRVECKAYISVLSIIGSSECSRPPQSDIVYWDRTASLHHLNYCCHDESKCTLKKTKNRDPSIDIHNVLFFFTLNMSWKPFILKKTLCLGNTCIRVWFGKTLQHWAFKVTKSHHYFLIQ